MPVSDRRLRLTAGVLVAVAARIWATAAAAFAGGAIGPSTAAVLLAVAVVRLPAHCSWSTASARWCL
jgi:hypothetical protein